MPGPLRLEMEIILAVRYCINRLIHLSTLLHNNRKSHFHLLFIIYRCHFSNVLKYIVKIKTRKTFFHLWLEPCWAIVGRSKSETCEDFLILASAALICFCFSLCVADKCSFSVVLSRISCSTSAVRNRALFSRLGYDLRTAERQPNFSVGSITPRWK